MNKMSGNSVIVNPGESVQEAIDRNKGSNKSIVLAKGVHTLKAPLKIYSGTTLSGYGKESILFLSPEMRTETIVNGEDNISHVAIRDILMEGNDKDGITIDAMQDGCREVILRNNCIQNNGRFGLMTKNTTGLEEGGNVVLFNAEK